MIYQNIDQSSRIIQPVPGFTILQADRLLQSGARENEIHIHISDGVSRLPRVSNIAALYCRQAGGTMTVLVDLGRRFASQGEITL